MYEKSVDNRSEIDAADSVSAYAESALRLTNLIHNQLDDIELRVFDPVPTAIEATKSEAGRPSLSQSILLTNQRLERAGDRLGKLLQRL